MSWHLLKMFKISDFFVNLPAIFKLCSGGEVGGHSKQKKKQPTNGFFFLFLLRIREGVSLYRVKTALLSSFPEDQSCTLLAGTPVSCVLTYCSALPEDKKCVIQVWKSEIRRMKDKSICNSLSVLYEYPS